LVSLAHKAAPKIGKIRKVIKKERRGAFRCLGVERRKNLVDLWKNYKSRWPKKGLKNRGQEGKVIKERGEH